MSRYTGPKLRKMRRLNCYLPGLTRKEPKTRTGTPGMHIHRFPKLSDYALRLREKQRLRFNYGLHEGQLRRMFQRALRMKGDTGVNLLTLLEARLDNVVFRAGFAPTIPAARQLVTHGHVLINGRKLDIASYTVRPGDTISVHERLKKGTTVFEGQKEFMRLIPSFIEVDTEQISAQVVGRPSREDVMLDVDANLIIEFYSH